MLVEAVAGYRPADQVALDLVAALLLQQGQVRFSLHPLRNHSQAQRMSHGNDRRGDRRVIGVNGDLPDEGPVDLERVQREVLQVAEGGVAGSEIVHRQVETHGPECVQRLGAFLVVVDQDALGELETEVPGLQPANL